MRKWSIVVILGLMFCAAAPAAELDPASSAPADAAVFITVRDVRLLVPAAELLVGFVDQETVKGTRLFLPKLAPMTTGRASYAFLPPTAPGREPAFLFRAPIDETKGDVHKLLTDVVTQLVGEKNAKPAADGAIRELCAEDGTPYLFWAVHKGTFYVSMDKARIALVLNPAPKPVRALVDDPAYKALAKHVDWSGDVTAFVDLERLVWRETTKPDVGIIAGSMGWLFHWLAPDEVPAAGLSWKGDGKTASGRIAALLPEPKKRSGITALHDLPNAPLAHLDRIPSDAALYTTCASTAGTVGRIARFLAGLDPDVGKEFETELAEFNKELGIDVGADLFDNLGAVAAGLHGGKRGPELLYVSSVRDEDRLVRCANALADYNKTPLRKHERNGRTYHILPTKPPMGWTFDDGRLLFSNTFEAAEEMIALGKAEAGGKPSLATQPMFQKLRLRLPKEAVTFCALDAHRAAKAVVGLLGLAALGGEMPKKTVMLAKLLDPFSKAEPGLSVGVALRNEPGALVLHVESLAGDPLALVGTAVRAETGKPKK